MNKALNHKIKQYGILALILIIVGQLIFVFYSPKYLKTSYTSRIYATTGVKHKQEDLHKLNEAAHYFGQTIIGWLKFPSFMEDLSSAVELPEGSSISAHIQERQNLIFNLNSTKAIEEGTLFEVKEFVQRKIDEYNSVSQTEFILTNFDYEQITQTNTYKFGAMVVFFLSLTFTLGVVIIKES